MNIFRKVYILLFIANLIPMVGVLFAKWGMTGYLFAYWVETYIISLIVICKYFLIVEKSDKGLRTLIHLLGGLTAVSALLLAILALLLKSISWKVAPGGSIPLPDLFQLFFNYITRYNFIVFALVPIGISIAIHIGWYIRSGAYRKTGLAYQVIEDLSLRFIMQGFIIVMVALMTEARRMVVIFFILRVVLEVYLHEDKLGRLDEKSSGRFLDPAG